MRPTSRLCRCRVADLGYALFKVVKVEPGEKFDDARRQSMLRQLTPWRCRKRSTAYLTALRPAITLKSMPARRRKEK